MAGVPGTAKDVKEHSSRDDVLGHATIEPESLTDQHGRTYQAYRPGKYFFPNDALEQDRLDTQHSMFVLALEGLYLAPIDKPAFVLDVCTGTGVWAREFAEAHPESAVLGIDLSSIQPRDNVPNCYFMKHDVEDPWSFGPSDYIHLRGTVACFQDTMSVITKCFQNLRPGGYIEFQDLLYNPRSDDGTHEGTHLQRFHEAVFGGLANMGRDVTLPARYKAMLIAAGFVNVHEQIIPVPCNGWPDDTRFKGIGKLSRLSMEKGLQATHRLLRATGLSEGQAVDLTQRAFMDASNRNFHAYYPLYVVYGQKPLAQWPGDVLAPAYLTTTAESTVMVPAGAWQTQPYEYMAVPPEFEGVVPSATPVRTEQETANMALSEMRGSGTEPGGGSYMAVSDVVSGGMQPTAW